MSPVRCVSLFKYSFDAAQQFAWSGEARYTCDASHLLPVCSNSSNTDNPTSVIYFDNADALHFLQVQGTIGFNLGVLIAMWLGMKGAAYLALRFIGHKPSER